MASSSRTTGNSGSRRTFNSLGSDNFAVDAFKRALLNLKSRDSGVDIKLSEAILRYELEQSRLSARSDRSAPDSNRRTIVFEESVSTNSQILDFARSSGGNPEIPNVVEVSIDGAQTSHDALACKGSVAVSLLLNFHLATEPVARTTLSPSAGKTPTQYPIWGPSYRPSLGELVEGLSNIRFGFKSQPGKGVPAKDLEEARMFAWKVDKWLQKMYRCAKEFDDSEIEDWSKMILKLWTALAQAKAQWTGTLEDFDRKKIGMVKAVLEGWAEDLLESHFHRTIPA